MPTIVYETVDDVDELTVEELGYSEKQDAWWCLIQSSERIVRRIPRNRVVYVEQVEEPSIGVEPIG